MRLTVISKKKRGNSMTKKAILLPVAAALLGIAAAVLVAQRKPAIYVPSETQALRLQVKQKDAVIAQKDMQAVQQRFQDALNALNAEAEKVKKENGWSPDIKFSPDTLG